MSKRPWFRFFPGDWLTDEKVNRMSLEEQGAYVRLLCFAWREGSLPEDIEALQRLCGCQPTELLLSCFPIDLRDRKMGRRFNKRLEIERKEATDFEQKRASAGKIGAKARWQSHAITNAIGIAKHSHTQSQITDHKHKDQSLKTNVRNGMLPKKPKGRSKSEEAALRANLEHIYGIYPRQEGKSRGMDKLVKDLRDHDDFVAFATAVENYAKKVEAEQTERKYIKLFSTFVSEWRDFVDYKPPAPKPRKLTNYSLPGTDFPKETTEVKI